MTKFQPTGRNVLLRPVEADDKSACGILIPDTAKDKVNRGQVLAVGPDSFTQTGVRTTVGVAVGQIVIFRRYKASEFTIGGEKLLILDDDDILGIVFE